MAVIPITKEAERTWDEIPSDGRSCTNRTETFYHQAWPFNSYIDDRKEAIQSIVAQIVPPASIAEDFLNVDDNIIEYIDGAFNVMMGGVSPIKVINSTMKYITSFWKKKKESAPVAIDEWNGNRPAGCLSIAFLQLLYYYKDVPSVKKGFPTLNRLYKYYNVETNQNSKYFGRFCRKNKETEDKHQDRLIGKLLFKIYRIKKKLGEGSFGKVYIAFNIETKESYAVKLVSKN